MRKVLTDFILPSECEVGKKYYYIHRIEGVDWSAENSYDNLDCWSSGWCIGFLQEMPLFVSSLNAEREDIEDATTYDVPRYCVDFFKEEIEQIKVLW